MKNTNNLSQLVETSTGRKRTPDANNQLKQIFRFLSPAQQPKSVYDELELPSD